MRLLSILLHAFGKFTDTTINLSPHASLHIVYGRNEAGKSTTLRAIESVLFEIDRQTTDDFIHPYNRMKVGAALLDEQGRTRTLYRRKGNRNTLLDERGEVVTKEELASIIGSISQREFGELYCLDKRRLLQGSRELLDTNGRIGPNILNAQIDNRPLLVAEALRAKADSLFKGHKSAATVIDRALLEYKEQKKIVATGDHREFSNVMARLKECEEERSRVLEAISRDRLSFAYGRRKLQAVSAVARFKEASSALCELESVGELSDDFEATFTQAWDSYITGSTKVDQCERSIALFREELNSLITLQDRDEEILACDTIIRELGSSISEYLRARDQRGKLEQVRARVRGEIEALAREVMGEDSLELPAFLSLPEKQRLRTLLDGRKEVVAALSHLKRDEGELEASIEVTKKELALRGEGEDLEGVKAAIASVKELGKIEDEIAKRRSNLVALSESLQSRYLRLSLVKLSLPEFLSAPCPSRALTGNYTKEFNEVLSLIDGARGEVKRTKEAIAETERQLSELESGDSLPSEEELTLLRSKRDHLVAAVVGQREERTSPSAIAFELGEKIAACDNLADALRRDAARLGQVAMLKYQRKVAREELTTKQLLLEQSEDALSKAKERWEREWPSGITVLTPEVMLDLLGERDELLRLQGEMQENEQELSTKLKQCAQAHELLSERSLPPASSLAERLQEAERTLASFEALARERAALTARLTDLSTRLAQSKVMKRHYLDELERLEKEWEECVRSLNVAGLIFSERAQECLDRIDALTEKRREDSKTQEELRQLEGVIGSFERTVTEVLQKLGCPADDLVEGVRTLLETTTEARARAERKGALRVSMERTLRELEEHRSGFTVASARVQEAMRLTKSDEPDQVRGAILLWRKKKGHLQELQRITVELRQLCSHDDLELFLSEVSEVDVPLLEEELALLEEKIREGEEVRDRHSQEIGALKKTKSDLENSTSLLDAQSRAEDAAARIHSALHPYLLYKMSARVVTLHMEEYRKRNQQPLLLLASNYFSRFTAGAYVELVPLYDGEIEDWVIMCRRAGDDSPLVPLTGLSQAGRAALFLSLRLASVTLREQRTGEKLPVILDDILVDLDDERAFHALIALAELSHKHQILFFTHHDHLVSLARNASRTEIEIVRFDEGRQWQREEIANG